VDERQVRQTVIFHKAKGKEANYLPRLFYNRILKLFFN